MKDDKARLRRLALLARIREIEHRNAAAQAFAAVGAGRRSRSLAQRAQDLAHGYDGRRDATCGYDLAAQRLAGLQTGQLASQTGNQAQFAEQRAREMVALEREARHRRDRVKDELERLTRQPSAAPLGENTQAARNHNNGTDVE